MKKVFIIHGFEGSPNGGWRPWLMRELEKRDIYACALPMPAPENPLCSEWVGEIKRQIVQNQQDDIYLIGHSLGGPAILRCLEQIQGVHVSGIILVSSPSERNNNNKLDSFLEKDFDFERIRQSAQSFAIIHGDNDSLVPLHNARFLAEKLHAKLMIIPNGKHLNGSAGCFQLPGCLDVLIEMFGRSK
ncbi:serine hydrolase family protein [Candidatus Gracilibacteria bacterium]|nr:serine hydrolase family protein [Candidatus Gracilibacteria bacterium]